MLTLLLLALFIYLGCWQLRRADEKRSLMSQAAAGQARIATLTMTNAEQLARYQHIRVRGTFDGEHQTLLDNMPSSVGRPGYRVWTPLKLEDGSIVLIDRGWIAKDMSHASNKVADSLLAVGSQDRTVTGIVDDLPRPGIRAGQAGIGSNWPQILNYPKLDELRTLYGATLQSRIVLMDADNADGFERRWQIKQGFGPERHIAYAVQWFGFAITLCIIYIVVNLKRETNTNLHD